MYRIKLCNKYNILAFAQSIDQFDLQFWKQKSKRDRILK